MNNTHFLEKYKLKAYIPAAQIERIGVIRFVPPNISNKELYGKLSSIYEIVAVRRFVKKVGQNQVPLQTVSITFLSNTLPDSVQYNLFSYRVFDYVPPLQQCYRCFKFNHSAIVCNGKQRCSCCSGEHSYKDCDRSDQLCCINCGGAHLAISRSCPIKLKKMLEKKNKITYAGLAKSYEQEFPPLQSKVTNEIVQNKTNLNNVNKVNIVNKPIVETNKGNIVKINGNTNIKSQIIANNDVLMALVHTIIQISNKDDDVPINTSSIKDMLIQNLPS